MTQVPGQTSAPRDATATRERILRAAEDVVLTDGVANLTLQKAAARAGLSKGGVLYHFKTRNDLVGAMVGRLAESFEEGLRAHHAAQLSSQGSSHLSSQGSSQAERSGSFARAYVEECLAAPVTEQDLRTERVGSAVLAAIASQPSLLEPLREAFGRWQAQLEQDAPDPRFAVRATVARFAADGLWLCELFGIDALTPVMRRQLTDELRRMVS